MKNTGTTSINLASDPFRRERAQNAAYALICVALLCCLLSITGFILRARAQASALQADIEREQATLRSLQSDQGRYSVILSRHQDVFAISVFLNELIARRAVSWTQVFEDLGTVMPRNMRLETIRLPQIPAQDSGGVNRIQLDMSVGTDRPETVNTLLNNLEQSPSFGAAIVVNQTPPTQNDPLYRFRVTVPYAQKL